METYSISHLEAKLVCTALDSIPTSEPACKVDIARHAEISRVDDFVGRGVIEDYNAVRCLKA